MKSIAMFNNKGGVGKTTLGCNLASFLSIRFEKKVLVVDCDPQCNATQLMMGEDYITSLYWEDSKNNITTIKSILQPIEDGDSEINKDIKPIPNSQNRFSVDIIPGHPELAIIEDKLGSAWQDSLAGDVGGIRKTNWNTDLCKTLSSKYDFIIFDLGPSLGSVNRSVLTGCDFFLTPMGTDIFSILGVKNIAEWLKNWTDLYSNSLRVCQSRAPKRLESYVINKELPIKKGYIGYTIQQYITKSKEGIRRPTKAYEDILIKVPEVIEKSIGDYRNPTLKFSNLNLGDVPHLYSLVPLAQSVSSPIINLNTNDGLIGSQFKQREEYSDIIGKIASNMLKNIGVS